MLNNRPMQQPLLVGPTASEYQSNVQGGSNMTGSDLCVNLATSVPVNFEPPCIISVDRPTICFKRAKKSSRICGYKGICRNNMIRSAPRKRNCYILQSFQTGSATPRPPYQWIPAAQMATCPYLLTRLRISGAKPPVPMTRAGTTVQACDSRTRRFNAANTKQSLV